MTEFELYLRLGFKHIIDLHGYDHMLFILSLTASYRIKEIKNVVILITAFTIGHSISLALSTLKFIFISAPIIEFLIPLTILITAVQNFFPQSARKIKMNYAFSILFGLIHGLGFSNYLKMLLGSEISIVFPLLAFNIGLEIGQLLIVGIYFLLLYLYTRFLHQNHHYWKISISAIAGTMAVFLLFETRFW
ncbi:MAG TPA: HupE / UreJ protein [Bacteroidales bacterium]|nr:HupE / UreJ protein [Bacteroidales bacterium]